MEPAKSLYTTTDDTLLLQGALEDLKKDLISTMAITLLDVSKSYYLYMNEAQGLPKGSLYRH